MKNFVKYFELSAIWKRLLILNSLFLILNCVFAQQDPQYSMYMFNQYVINPAFGGSKDAVSATLMLRNQWVGIDGAPRTQTLSVHAPLSKKKIGLGLHVVTDQIGPVKTAGIFGSYSYKITLPKGKLVMGLRAGMFQYVYNWNAIDHYDQADNVYTQNRTSYIVPSADAGLYYYTRDMYIGLSATHLFNGRITSTTAPNGDNASYVPHAFLTVGKAFDISSSVILNPSFALRTAENSPVNADINLNALFQNRVWVGVSYRTSFGIVFLTQVVVTEKLKIGYSFDWGFTPIAGIGQGSHEFMMSYDFAVFGRSKMISPRYF